jgi:hypothetical protein
MKNKMKLLIIILYAVSFDNGCFSPSAKMNEKIFNDTLQRPAYMTENATLLNYGSDEDSIMVWADYMGCLTIKEKVYSHIHGVQYYYVKAGRRDTTYYESLELRSGVKKIDFKNVRVLKQSIGGANVGLFDGKDSLWLFHVLQSDEFNREHKGIHFTNMPTIELRNNEYMADVELEFNLKKLKEGKYELTLSDTSKVQYEACLNCNITNQKISFLNRQDGKIYFVDGNYYLELVNKDDVKRFQGLR